MLDVDAKLSVTRSSLFGIVHDKEDSFFPKNIAAIPWASWQIIKSKSHKPECFFPWNIFQWSDENHCHFFRRPKRVFMPVYRPSLWRDISLRDSNSSFYAPTVLSDTLSGDRLLRHFLHSYSFFFVVSMIHRVNERFPDAVKNASLSFLFEPFRHKIYTIWNKISLHQCAT